MPLVVEDGTIIANANSYISLADARAFLQSIGYDLDATDSVAESQLLKSMQAIEGMNFNGYRVGSAQSLGFPRVGIAIDGIAYESTNIPAQLPQAQSLLAYAVHNGDDFTATKEAAIVREKIDVLETEYKPSTAKTGVSIYDLPLVMAKLSPLLTSGLSMRIGRA